MQMFYADAIDECGHDASLETEAASKAEAWDYFEEQYPDMRIKNVISAQELQNRNNSRYNGLDGDDFD